MGQKNPDSSAGRGLKVATKVTTANPIFPSPTGSPAPPQGKGQQVPVLNSSLCHASSGYVVVCRDENNVFRVKPVVLWIHDTCLHAVAFDQDLGVLKKYRADFRSVREVAFKAGHEEISREDQYIIATPSETEEDWRSAFMRWDELHEAGLKRRRDKQRATEAKNKEWEERSNEKLREVLSKLPPDSFRTKKGLDAATEKATEEEGWFVGIDPQLQKAESISLGAFAQKRDQEGIQRDSTYLKVIRLSRNLKQQAPQAIEYEGDDPLSLEKRDPFAKFREEP